MKKTAIALLCISMLTLAPACAWMRHRREEKEKKGKTTTKRQPKKTQGKKKTSKNMNGNKKDTMMEKGEGY